MPHLAGLELVLRARELGAARACVVVSGLPAPPEADGVPWVRKPIDVDLLAAAAGLLL